MNNLRIKICGITNLEDALLCYQEGAHALGFIFTEQSPRHTNIATCKEITKALPPFCERVGVFVDEQIETICQTVQESMLSAVQLHGTTENPEYISKLHSQLSVPIIRALRISENSRIELSKETKQLITEIPIDKVQALLIDGPGKKQVPYEIFLKVQELSSLPLVLAGAINTNNVEELIKRLNAKSIDLSSSLEAHPGKKDPEKVKEFFKTIHLLQGRS